MLPAHMTGFSEAGDDRDHVYSVLGSLLQQQNRLS